MCHLLSMSGPVTRERERNGVHSGPPSWSPSLTSGAVAMDGVGTGSWRSWVLTSQRPLQSSTCLRVTVSQRSVRDRWWRGGTREWAWVRYHHKSEEKSHSGVRGQNAAPPCHFTRSLSLRSGLSWQNEMKVRVTWHEWVQHLSGSTLTRALLHLSLTHSHPIPVTRSASLVLTYVPGRVTRETDVKKGRRWRFPRARGLWECETRVHSFLTRVVPPLVGRNEWLKGVNDVRRVGLRWLPAVTHLVACHAASHFVRRRRWQKKD